MQRKIVGIMVAVIAALVGTFVLVRYVQTAETRATAGEELVEVYVVKDVIPAGTIGGENLADFVTVETVPMKVQAAGAVRSLTSLENKVSAVELVAGEQLVSQRFVTQADFINREVGVVVPPGMVEVTVELEPQRAVGGLIEPGDTVAVISSFDPFELAANVVEVDGEEVALPDAISADIQGKTPNTSGFILRKILVTAVQEDENTNSFNSNEEDQDKNRLQQAPANNLLITLAVDPADAERLVFTQEFGFVWLASERSDVPEYESELQTRLRVYEDAPTPPTVIQASN
ncbi:MAG: Flp pilus assembly protein CpaB [Acidimicrobiales bacterium]|nr:Flp pilus assembly protein CpaB [Acidimicrobiales bacterium]